MNEKTSQFTGKHKLDGTWVSELEKKVGLSVYERFAVCDKPTSSATKKGDAFLTVELGDKTGHVKLKVWNVPRYETDKAMAHFEQGKVYVFDVQVREYKERAELNMNWPANGTGWPWLCAETDFFMEDFCDVPSNRTTMPIPDMVRYLRGVIAGIKHDGYRRILGYAFSEERLAIFSKWPASRKHHHACIGGLLQHVYEMLKLVEVMIALNPQLNADLLRTAIAFHDIGKLQEYTLGMHIGANDDAFAVGHMVIAVKEIFLCVMKAELDQAALDPKDVTSLEHLIMSHHGPVELGYGSAVSPKTPEAVALYRLDELSAQVNGAIWSKDAKPRKT